MYESYLLEVFLWICFYQDGREWQDSQREASSWDVEEFMEKDEHFRGIDRQLLTDYIHLARELNCLAERDGRSERYKLQGMFCGQGEDLGFKVRAS